MFIFFSLPGLLTFVNCWNVKRAAQVQNVFTVAKLLALGIVILIGIYQLALGKTRIWVFRYFLSGFFLFRCFQVERGVLKTLLKTPTEIRVVLRLHFILACTLMQDGKHLITLRAVTVSVFNSI